MLLAPQAAPALLATAAAGVAAIAATAATSCTNLAMVFVTQFGTPQDGQECWGLRATKTGPLGNPIKDAQERGSACCATATCRPSNKKAQRAIVERGPHVNGLCATRCGFIAVAVACPNRTRPADHDGGF